MEKLLDILNQYVELKLIVVNQKPYVMSHQEQPEEYEGQLYLFTLTPPNNINFDESLYSLFSDSHSLRTKATLCASSIEFCVAPTDEDELNKLMTIFENILQSYQTLLAHSKKQEAALKEAALKIEESNSLHATQKISPPPSPTLSLSEPVTLSITSSLPESPTDSLQAPLLSSLSLWGNAVDWNGYANEKNPSETEDIKEKLYNCLIKLMELLEGRTESPKGFFGKPAQYVKNNVNYYTNGSSAIRVKEDIKEYTQSTANFSAKNLKGILDILNNRLNHVQNSKEHQVEIVTLRCALDYAKKLMAEESQLVLSS